ncbi:hypothetical protein ACFL6B_06015, partial [Thermodesulfobacteriota bacterium]
MPVAASGPVNGNNIDFSYTILSLMFFFYPKPQKKSRTSPVTKLVTTYNYHSPKSALIDYIYHQNEKGKPCQ